MAEDIQIGDIVISEKTTGETFIIAEIGQNHQGDLELAKKLIKVAKNCGAHCAKFQKTCLTEKFNKKALMRPYLSENSFGATYGEHKEFLEFSEEQFRVLQCYAKEIGIMFSSSAMDPVSLRFLIELDLPFIKIGSGDSNNLILIEEAAKCGKPLIISTGMLNFDEVQKIYDTVTKYHNKLVLMHCVSGYPTPYNELNLKVIQMYKKKFQKVHVGYSSHEIGAESTPAAIILGAKVIERHLTLCHDLKGSDHKCSLLAEEFSKMVETIHLYESTLGSPEKRVMACELPCKAKLGKTLVASKNLKKGHVLMSKDLKIKVAEPKGLDGSMFNDCIGQVLLEYVEEDESITKEHVILS